MNSSGGGEPGGGQDKGKVVESLSGQMGQLLLNQDAQGAAAAVPGSSRQMMMGAAGGTPQQGRGAAGGCMNNYLACLPEGVVDKIIGNLRDSKDTDNLLQALTGPR